MVRQRGRETQIQVYEPHYCYITESWEIIKMERMYMCKGWMLRCCWDSHKRLYGLHKATVQCNTLQYNTFNSLRAKFISWTYKCIWHGTGSGNPSSCKTRSKVAYSTYHGCRCPGDARRQVINSHDTEVGYRISRNKNGVMVEIQSLSSIV